MASSGKPAYPSMTIGIIGTGDFGRALGKVFISHGIGVLFGSRNPKDRKLNGFEPELASASIVSISKCIEGSNIVFLCIRSCDHPSIYQYAEKLNNRILVDVSNPNSKIKQNDPGIVKRLAAQLPDARIVKALHTVSSYWFNNSSASDVISAPVFSDDVDAKAEVRHLLRTIGLNAVDGGTLEAAATHEKDALVLLGPWTGTLVFSAVHFMGWWVLCIFRYFIFAETLHHHAYKWDRVFSNITNKCVAFTAIALLACCYLPGAIMAYRQLSQNSKYRPSPGWLHRWMKARKQLGLMALFLAFIHACFSMTLMNSDYFSNLFVFRRHNITLPINEKFIVLKIDSEMDWEGESMLLAGVVSLALMSILGIVSSPAISTTLTWRQWTFINSTLGFVCLLTSTCHCYLRTVGTMVEKTVSENLTNFTIWGAVLPSLVILVKLPLYLPFVSKRVEWIRSGKADGGSSISRESSDMEMGIQNDAAYTSVGDSESSMKMGEKNGAVYPAVGTSKDGEMEAPNGAAVGFEMANVYSKM